MRWVPLSRHYACPNCRATYFMVAGWLTRRT